MNTREAVFPDLMTKETSDGRDDLEGKGLMSKFPQDGQMVNNPYFT